MQSPPPPGGPPNPYGYGPQAYGQQPQGYAQPHGYPQQAGYPQQGYAPQAASARPPVRMSSGAWISLQIVGLVATTILAVMAQMPSTREAIPFVPLPILVIAIANMVFIYKMWSAINDGQTKPTPGAALGLLFIPFFSLYWIFVVFPGFATQYNKYVQRRGIRAEPLGQGIFIATLLLGWVPLLGTILYLVMIATICSAVNKLS